MVHCDRCNCELRSDAIKCVLRLDDERLYGTKYARIDCHVCDDCGKAIASELPQHLRYRITIPPKPSRSWWALRYIVEFVGLALLMLGASWLLKQM